MRVLGVALLSCILVGCAPGDPRFDVKDDATYRCLKERGLTSDWELERGYKAAIGVSAAHLPNQVTSVHLAFASAHCTVGPEREELLKLLRASGYVDPTRGKT